MTLSLKHKFTSAIPDAGDPTIVQPSNWNDEHALTQATATILGRVTPGTGVTEELTPAQARTLLNVADGATANSSDAFLLARANHTGTESADVLTDGTTNKAFLATERTKLAGIATGATANSTDAFLLARANHTGTLLAATISDFSSAADARVAAAVGVSVQGYDADLALLAALNIVAGDANKAVFVNGSGNGFEKVNIGNIGYPARFGTYDNTGAADSAAAINSALSSYKYVELGEGTFKLGSTVTYPSDGRKLLGVGKKRTILRPSTANLPGISIPTGRVNCEAIGISVDRSVAATAGGDGIAVGQTNLTNLRDIECLNNYIGLNLGPIGFGQVSDYFIHDNYSHGILMTNNATLGTLQWYLFEGLLQANDGWGALVAQSALGAMDLLMGDWDGVKTFANTSGGLGFAGSAANPIKGIRLKNGFIGADGGSLGEIYLDTYGGLHCIENMFAESAGQVATGRGFATAASNHGSGLLVTANNTDVEVLSLKALSNKDHGFSMSATAYNKVIGGYSRGNGGWGAVFADGAKATLVGMEFDLNTTGPVVALSNASKLKAIANIPDSVNNNGQRTGTATNDNADAGNVGEYVESVVASGSGVSLTTATAKDMTTISLTAGDWDVEFLPGFTGGGTTTVNYLVASVSSGATNTLDQTNGRYVAHNFSAGTLFNAVPAGLFGFAGITVRFSLSATTTIRAVVQAAFGTSTCTAHGVLRARRVR
ncbi:MAG: hypothetical protein E5V48_02645 [Mesorhizobium sp.]|nr:MAG: hypothetical protein E5V48_02645 [Mesorhizobium sp.]